MWMDQNKQTKQNKTTFLQNEFRWMLILIFTFSPLLTNHNYANDIFLSQSLPAGDKMSSTSLKHPLPVYVHQILHISTLTTVELHTGRQTCCDVIKSCLWVHVKMSTFHWLCVMTTATSNKSTYWQTCMPIQLLILSCKVTSKKKQPQTCS